MRNLLWLFGVACLIVSHVDAAEPPGPPSPSSRAIHLIRDEAVTFDSTTPPRESAPNMDLGTRDFRIGLEFRIPKDVAHDLGDMLSLWDGERRVGFHLGLRNNTGCTSSQPNWRHLEFGIDAGTEPKFQDEGRPGESMLGFALCVHEGELYVATCEPGRDQAGKVYRYDGLEKWIDLGRLDGANSVSALANFNGHLYAGTGKYRLGGSALPNSENEARGGRVYRFEGPGKWKVVGDLSPTEAVAALVNFRGRLYATSLYAPAGFFRYEEDGKWTSIPTPNNKRVNAVGVHDGDLFATSYDSGAVYRFDGTAWTDLGIVGENTQTYSFTPFGGKLHVGTWPSGRIYRWETNAWKDTGRLGQDLEVMAMLPYNGAFYAGSLPLAEIYRFDGDGKWTRLKQLDETPDVKYRRVWTMAAYRGKLFCTTLPSGKIWSMSTGACVTHDRELDAEWHSVLAERKQGSLTVSVDHKVIGQTTVDAKLALPTKSLTLRVGSGPRGPFVGQLKDVWIDIAE
jgi:hypothetical protein